MSSSNETNMDSTNINDLRENFNKQQVKITALKELVRKSGVVHDKATTTTQEKVKSIAQRLTHLKSKARARQQQQTQQNLSTLSEFNDISSSTSIIEDQDQQQQQQHSVSLPTQSSSSSSLLLSLSSNEGLTSTPMVVTSATATDTDSDITVTDTSFTFIDSTTSIDANNMQRRARSETPSSEKIQLLRQQMEQNKLKIAKRESNKREIEEMVIQLKQRLDTTQQSLEKSSEFSGKSMSDLSTFMKITNSGMKFNSSASDLNTAATITSGNGSGFNLDKERIKFLDNRIRLLEKQLDKEKEKNQHQQQQQQAYKSKDHSDGDDVEKQQLINQLQNQIIDLQENLKEKDTIIDARTKAISLMTEDFSIKSKLTVDKLEDTRQEMFKMQQLFSETDENYKIKINKLLEDLHEKTKQIEILEENLKKEEKENNKLITSEDNGKQIVCTKTESEVSDDAINLIITEYLEKMKDLQSQIDILQKENNELKEEQQLRHSTITNEDTETDQLVEKNLQTQNKQQQEETQNLITRIRNLEEQLQEKTIECNVLNANFSVLQEKLKSTTMPKLLFPKSQDESFDCETNKLKSQLEESNRSMIKMKLKIKQLQKEIDGFKKISNVHSEVIRLTEENDMLKQKLIEINEESKQMQLKCKTTTMMVTNDCVSEGKAIDESELEKKVQILEATCQNQTSAIQLLEEQKLDMTENLQKTKLELETLKDDLIARGEEFNENVKDGDQCHRHDVTISSQMELIKLEENINDLKSQVLELNETICVQKSEINSLKNDKLELSRKIDHYMAENIELLDKIEKLSKSSSSAESIEIVERLTQQEKQEIEELHQRQQQQNYLISETVTSASGDHENHDIITKKSRGTQKTDEKYDAELNENLIKLREESSELQHKIELFTKERHEVLDKMEHLTIENQEHVERIKQLLETKLILEKNNESLQKELQIIKIECEKLISDKYQMFDEIQDMRSNEKQIIEELSKLTKEKDSLEKKSVASSATISPLLDNNLIEICERSLQRLNNEIENYEKSNDKNNKLTISRKLVKQSKNVYNQMINLLSKLKDGIYLHSSTISVSSTSSPTTNFDSDIDKNVSIDLINRLQDFEKIIENVQNEFDLLRKNSDNKDDQIQKLSNELNNFQDVSKELQQQLVDDKTKYQYELDHLQKIRKELENKLNVSDQEIEILKALVAEQKQQLIDSYTEHEIEINNKLKIIRDYEANIESLKHELDIIRSDKKKLINNYNEKLETTIQQLQNIVRDNEILIVEQSKEIQHKQNTIDTLNEQIITLYHNLEENTKEIAERDAKIEEIQHSLNKNCNKLTTITKQNKIYENRIDELLNELRLNSDKLSQLEEYNKNNESEIDNLKKHLTEFETTNVNLTERNKELHEKLKKFAANLKKKQIQCNDLEIKLKQMENDKAIEEQEKQNAEEKRKNDNENNEKQIIEIYQSENNEMRSILNERQIRIQHLEDEVSLLRNEIIDRVTENQELQGRYEVEIENIKSELIECNTLKTMLHKQIEEKQQKIIEMQTQINDEQDRIRSIQTDISAKDLKLEKCKAFIKEKNKEIKRLTMECENLEKQLKEQQQIPEKEKKETDNANILNDTELKSQLDKLQNNYIDLQEKHKNETEVFQNTIKRLEQCYDGIQAKLQENLNYIETLEYENTKYKDNVIKLENCLAIIEDKRSTLELSKNLLNKQLENRQIEYEKNEDALVQRLNMLSEHDDHIGRLLLETQEENQELLEKLDNLKIGNNDLMKKFTQIEKDYQQFKQNDYEQLKSDNQFIKQQYDQQQNEILKLQQNFDNQLAKKDIEIDELENELSIQLKQINQEKRSLQENYEKAMDDNQELKDEICRLKESLNSIEQQKIDLERENTWIKMQNENYVQDQIELQELRKQLIQDKNDIDQLTHQLDTLKLQISELDSIRMQVSQNQTDDQVFIETENKKLKELLSEKDILIENYQKQNLQLQMAAAATASTLSSSSSASAAAAYDPFSSIIIDQHQQQQQQQMQIPLTSQTDDDQTGNSTNVVFTEKIKKLENDLSQMRGITNEKDEQIRNLLKDNENLQERFDDLSRNITELQITCNEKEKEYDNLREELNQFKHSSHIRIGGGSAVHEDEIISIFNVSNEQLPTASMTAASTSTASVPIMTMTNVFSDILTKPSTNASTAIDDGAAAAFDTHEQKKIEDLERNVSDLEKYANDLEMKLKNLTVLHEETVRNYEEKIAKLEERIIELQMTNTANSVSVTEKSSLQVNQNQNSQTNDNQMDHTDEVHEELIVPKKAYICQPSDQIPLSQPPTSLSIGLNEDDDWAWGSEDAKLELQHFTEKTAANNISNDGNGNDSSSIQRYFTASDDEEKQSLKAKLKEYQQQIDELKFERNRLDEQKIELQVKSGKMMKKLKEYKTKIDQLSSTSNNAEAFRKSSSCESNDLDLAIQEELKSQLQITENALQIIKDQLRKEIQEKENLLKRCDVLSQSNDRLIDLKEKNEIHIVNLQSEINRLNEQIKNLNDWSNNSSITATTPVKLLSNDNNNISKQDQQTIESHFKENLQENNDDLIVLLKRELEDIKCDRDELQVLLNEEKQQSKMYENDLRNLQIKILGLEELSESLRKENIERQKHIDDVEKVLLEKSKLQFDERKKENNIELERKLKELIEQNEKLQLELNKTNSDSSNYQEELNSMIQYKNDEIEHLKLKIEQIMAEKDANNEIIKLKQNENNELKRNIQILKEEQEQQIKDHQQQYSNQIDQNHSNSNSIIDDDYKNSLKIQEQIQEIQQLSKENKSLLNEKEQMEEELRILNNHVIENLAIEDKMKKIALELDMKNIEITELKNSLKILQKRLDDNSNHSISSNDDKKDEIVKELDTKWNHIVEQKCKEIADSWREHLEIKENEFRKIENNLREQLQKALIAQNTNENKIQFDVSNEAEEIEIETDTDAEGIEVNEKRNDNVVIDSPEEIIKKMQTVLENQEIEIVTLKEQLAIRSAEYARLAAKHDPYGQITSSTSSSSSGTMSTIATISTPSNSNQNNNMVPKSELDLAWYMLHQREMRCEELTLELVNLLEERDTLQLKLSNSLRQIEEIKQKMRQSEKNSSGGDGCGNITIESGSDSDPGINLLDSPIKLSTMQQQVQNLSLDKENITQDNELDVKLSQLHAVHYSKDKRSHAERDQRQRQMEQIQQDIANIPSEAVSELIGTNTSNVIESPSTVLFNWLWGKSSNQ